MAVTKNTKQKILDVAEQLFSDNGFTNTSLRMITTQANVNLASVNYHFGDKKTLIRSVLERYLEYLMPQVRQALTELNQQPHYSMLDVFNRLRSPMLSLNQLTEQGTSRFMLLVGRGYSDVQGHLRWFITERYGDVLDLLVYSMQKANPQLNSHTLFLRLHFTLGTCVFTMASSQALTEIAHSDFDYVMNSHDLIDEIIPYLAAGMSLAKSPSRVDRLIPQHSTISKQNRK